MYISHYLQQKKGKKEIKRREKKMRQYALI